MPIDTSGEFSPDNISKEVLDQLPDDLQAAIVAAQINQQNLIKVLGDSVAKRRDEAVRFRTASGIETEWQEDEEFYDGIDDANRGESKYIKPNHPSGVLTAKNITPHKGSTVFMNITRQYVDSAAASVSEMGNPTDNRNFSLKPTPVLDIEAHADNATPHPAVDANGQPVQATVADFVEKAHDDAEKKALAAQDQIDTWLIQSQWHAHLRHAVHDAAMAGTGVVKGPFPNIFKGIKSVKDGDGKTGVEMKIETVPASKRIDKWNCFPSPDCGHDIQRGSYFLERDFINARALRDMKLLNGYMTTQIEKVLEEGPIKNPDIKSNRTNFSVAEDSEEYEVWYYYGILTREEVDAMGVLDSLAKSENETDQKSLKKIEELESCPCIVTLVNDTPVNCALNPLDSGEYPYDMVIWEKRPNSPWGKGIARIMRTAQRVTTAALRNLMDNAGLSGGVQVGFKKGAVRPMGKDWKLSNITFWEFTDDDVSSINDVLSFHQIPSIQKELMEIIQFGQKMAEDVTGMPLLLQGQTGSAPDTVGGMQLLNKNATATRRMVARQLDDDVVEPHIRRYYQWILQYSDDENMKGDYTIDARGSQALVERDIARQFSIQMVQNALQSSFGIDPYKAMQQTLRAEMIDPSTWQFDEETYKKNMQAQSQAGNPVIQAAQIRAQSAEKIAAEQIAADTANAKTTADATVSAVQARTQRDDAFAQASLQAKSELGYKTLEIQKEIALLQYATQEKISLNAAKVQMANKTMELQTEKELAGAANQMDAAIHVSEQVHAGAAQEAEHAHAKDMQGADIAKAGLQQNEDANIAADTQSAQQQHERYMAGMAQRHAQEMADAQHKHEINVANLKPAVQVPGRAANGHALDQTGGKK